MRTVRSGQEASAHESGMGPLEIRAAVSEALARYLKEPLVDVAVVRFGSQRFIVVGEAETRKGRRPHQETARRPYLPAILSLHPAQSQVRFREDGRRRKQHLANNPRSGRVAVRTGQPRHPPTCAATFLLLGPIK
jgi:protein involved in polysaccharide export with SLBB domain